MEMTHRGAEAESLLRPDHRTTVIPHNSNKNLGWDAGEPEKAPFLKNEPVKLTPAWEGTDHPNDTLNLKGITMDLAPPQDKYNLIYLTLMLHGLGTLTAWNMFITAEKYFTDFKMADQKEYASLYLVAVGYASQIPNLVFSWLNVFVQIRGSLTTRIVWSLIIEVLMLVVTIILAMLDTSEWTVGFFWITMITVLILNTFNAIFQNSVYGVAARLPPRYTGAVVLGSNIAGLLIVALNMISGYMTGSLQTAAIYYFIGGMFVLLACFDTYFALPLNRFYRYHESLEQRTFRMNPALAASNQDPPASKKTPYGTIFRQSWVQLYNIFITFFVTLAIFPNVQAGVKPITEGFLGDQFTMITCFLTFNLLATIGNITASLWQFPSRRYLWIFTSLRLPFLIFFYLSNYHPKGELARSLPVLINNDYVYWTGGALMAWSSGHGSSLGMMYVSGTVAPEYAAKAGMIGAATLITGIISGITCSGFAPKIVTSAYW